MRIRVFAGATSLLAVLVGCAPDAPVPVCTGATVDIRGLSDGLGSVGRLDQEMERIVAAGGQATLLEITHAAGWSDEWDHLVDAYPGVDPIDLNRALGIDIAPECWRGLPAKQRHYDDDARGGLYVFFRSGRPVQIAVWPAHRKLIDIDAGVGLTPESLLVTDPRKRVLRPAP